MRSQRERSCEVPFRREGGCAGHCRSLNHSVQGFEARKPPKPIAFLRLHGEAISGRKKTAPLRGKRDPHPSVRVIPLSRAGASVSHDATQNAWLKYAKGRRSGTRKRCHCDREERNSGTWAGRSARLLPSTRRAIPFVFQTMAANNLRRGRP